MEIILFLSLGLLIIILIILYCIFYDYRERKNNIRTEGTVISCEKSEVKKFFMDDEYRINVKYMRDGVVSFGVIYDRFHNIGDKIEVLYIRNSNFFSTTDFYDNAGKEITKKNKNSRWNLNEELS